jgi:hypothetical protein
MKPNNNDIYNAKQFVLNRIEDELKAVRGASSLIEEATRKIITISKKYKINPKNFRFSANKELKEEVDKVIKQLKYAIYDLIVGISVYEFDKDNEDMLAFLNSTYFNKTLKERLGIYTNRLKFEIEAAIAAGLFLNNGIEKILKGITTHIKAPYTNPDIISSFGKGLSATRINTKGISYGVGHSNSSFNALERLIRNTVASSRMWWMGENAKKSGATGFFSFRGSSYPCAYCDSMVGYHPIEEYQYIWHPNCRCYFVFV